MKIAIIGGSGKMGMWFARFLLKEGFQVVLSDKDEIKLAAFKQEPGVEILSNIEAVQNSDGVLISVNIDSFEEVVQEIAPYIKSDQYVVDITSIKESPVEVMHRHLKTAKILGTHPLFGPGAKDLNGQNFVLTPSNPQEFELAEQVQHFLESRGARVTLMSAREHDEMMAVVLGLAHFISIVSADTLIDLNHLTRMKAIGGSTYRVLSTLVESVISEDPELYATLQMHLPGLAKIEERFQSNTAKWFEYVKNRDKQGFKDNMTALKNKFAEKNSDFGQAYQNMYKIIEWL